MGFKVYIGGGLGVEPLNLGFALAVDSASPSTVSNAGGDKIVMLGSEFPTSEDLEVFVGNTGDPLIDQPCFGTQGYGYLPQSPDGLSVTVVTPPLEICGLMKVTVKQVSTGDIVVSDDILTVLERHWATKQFDTRQGFPPWYEAGNRRLDLEAAPCGAGPTSGPSVGGEIYAQGEINDGTIDGPTGS